MKNAILTDSLVNTNALLNIGFGFSKNTLDILNRFDVPEDLIGWCDAQYKQNDIGHRHDHIDQVISQAYRYSRNEMLSRSDTRCAIIAALMHDTGCHVDRELHHEIGAKVARICFRKFSCMLTLEEENKIVNAIREHRASFEGMRSGIVSDVVSAADRGNMTTEECLRRSYLYARSAEHMNHDEARRHAVAKIKDKFGNNGYCYTNLPRLAMEGNDIERLKTEVENTSFCEDVINSNYQKWLNAYKEHSYAISSVE